MRGAGPVMNYYPRLAKYVGGVTPAVLLCALVWRDKDIDSSDEDSMVFTVRKSLDLICRETGLTDKEVRWAREMLERLGIISCEYLRVDRILEFTVSLTKLDDIGDRGAPAEKAGATPAERADRDLPKGQIDHYSENKREKEREEIDTTQKILPWMEKVFRNSQKCHKLPWKKPKYEIDSLVERVGQVTFRTAWLTFIDDRETPDVFEFLRDMRESYPKQSNVNSKKNSGNGTLQKTTAELFREKNPHLFTQAQ